MVQTNLYRSKIMSFINDRRQSLLRRPQIQKREKHWNLILATITFYLYVKYVRSNSQWRFTWVKCNSKWRECQNKWMYWSNGWIYVAWQIQDPQFRFIPRCSVTRLSSQATPNIDLRPTHRLCVVTSLFWSLRLRDMKWWGVI